MKLISLSLLVLILFSCSEFSDKPASSENSEHVRKLPGNMEYKYDCLKAKSDTGKLSGILDKAGKVIGTIATINIEVTDQEQMNYGDTFLVEAAKDKNFVIDTKDPVNAKLNTILQKLVDARINPTGIKYKIYLLDDSSTINAYTVGGKIFITSAMIRKCENDDQLYAIIGHEVGHNEKGHIKSTIKQLKASNRFFGEWGESFFAIKRLLTGSFNQKSELEADYYGLDLTWMLGYDVCAIRTFWDAMAKGESRNAIEDFFRTHPHSDTRSSCLVRHIEKNFEVKCN